MGIRSRKTGDAFAYAQRTINQRYDETIESVVDDMWDVMDDSADSMRDKINSRGVRDTVPNARGRGTGKMADEVDAEVNRRGDVVSGRFGWLPGRPRRPELGWQETGTLSKGEPSGSPSPVPGRNRGIRPMLALADAEAEARLKLQARFRGRRG